VTLLSNVLRLSESFPLLPRGFDKINTPPSRLLLPPSEVTLLEWHSLEKRVAASTRDASQIFLFSRRFSFSSYNSPPPPPNELKRLGEVPLV